MVLSRTATNVLNKTYYDASHPAGYGTAQQLFRHLKTQKHVKASLADIKDWLAAQTVYTLHKRRILKYPERKIITHGVGFQYQADLIVLPAIQRENGGNRYIFVIIDVFSRFAYAEPCKTKSPADVITAFSRILKRMSKPPIKLQTDQGTEFLGSLFQKFLAKHKIIHFFSYSDNKAAIVERFIRTLCTRLYKYMSENNTLNYTRVLPHMINSYNGRIHRSIGIAPRAVNKTNEQKIWTRQYGKYLASKKKQKFIIGDKVRLSKIKSRFEKGYKKSWTTEIFMIIKVHDTIPFTYSVVDKNNEPILGVFYTQQLVKVL